MLHNPHLTCIQNLWGFPDGSAGKEFACSTGDTNSIPGLGRSPGGRDLPTPVFLLEKSHGERNPAGNSRKGHKESVRTEKQNTNTHRENLYLKIITS